MGHECFGGVSGEVLGPAGQSFDGLLGQAHHRATHVALPMRAGPHQPGIPGKAVAQVLAMVPHKGQGVRIVAVGQRGFRPAGRWSCRGWSWGGGVAASTRASTSVRVPPAAIQSETSLCGSGPGPSGASAPSRSGAVAPSRCGLPRLVVIGPHDHVGPGQGRGIAVAPILGPHRDGRRHQAERHQRLRILLALRPGGWAPPRGWPPGPQGGCRGPAQCPSGSRDTPRVGRVWPPLPEGFWAHSARLMQDLAAAST